MVLAFLLRVVAKFLGASSSFLFGAADLCDQVGDSRFIFGAVTLIVGFYGVKITYHGLRLLRRVRR